MRQPSPKQKQTRAEQVRESWLILEWLILQREGAGELVSAVVRRIEDRHELADARADLQQIANTLGSVITRRGSRNPVWQQYQHHFVGDRNRERFFAQLRSLTRRFASACLVIGKPEGKPDDNLDKAFPWNSSLLPRSIAPHVSRVVILHPGLLENFLPRFFFRHQIFGPRNPRIVERC